MSVLCRDVNYDDFQYIVERKKPDPICFGSKIPRNTNPIGKGLSPFQRRYATETYEKISPQTYDTEHLTSGLARLQNKIRSNKGVGGLASRSPRLPPRTGMRVPSPTRYYLQKRWGRMKKSKSPFGGWAPRKFYEETDTPGVGFYNTVVKYCKRTMVAYNFGRPKMVPAAETVCSPVPPDACDRCNDVCLNDYWHINHVSFLCHPCMRYEMAMHTNYTKKQLQQYKKIRTCSYKHSHEGTTAAVQLLTNERLKKMDQVENYLNLYLKDF